MAIISNGTTIADAGAFSASLGSKVLLKTTTVTSATANVTFVHGTRSGTRCTYVNLSICFYKLFTFK